MARRKACWTSAIHSTFNHLGTAVKEMSVYPYHKSERPRLSDRVQEIKLKTGIIIQARTSATRLPAKVLKDLPYGSGISVLAQCIRRCKQAKKADQVIVATTVDPADEAIVKIAKKEKVKYFKGSLQNVLERYYLAAKENKLDRVVRITSDCPCIDPKIIDHAIAVHEKEKADYASNTVQRTFAGAPFQ